MRAYSNGIIADGTSIVFGRRESKPEKEGLMPTVFDEFETIKENRREIEGDGVEQKYSWVNEIGYEGGRQRCLPAS